MCSDVAESSNMAIIRTRIEQRRQEYIRSNFSRKKNDILKTFFDLSQEFDTIPNLFRICVVVPHESLGVDTRLYLINDQGELDAVCDSEHGVCSPPCAAPENVRVSDVAYAEGQSYFVPIYTDFTDHHKKCEGALCRVMGMFEVMPIEKLTLDDKIFFTKYTNRIGYNLRKKRLAQQNINHLKFINSLVDDIEHNVVIPNMHYKSLFHQLKRYIDNLNDVVDLIEEFHKENQETNSEICRAMSSKIAKVTEDLNSSYEDIDKHHVNLSLFLESLLRRDHFEKGYLVLKRRICKLDSEIIAPQLDNYEKRMLMRGISIEKPQDMQGEEIEIDADLGLLSQVYANLFSNALKYTHNVMTEQGNYRKAVTYGRKIIKGHWGHGQDGIKLNVFSTGEHVSVSEMSSLFEDGFIGHNHTSDLSRGHGLAFIKYVVEMHGGIVGYEPTKEGNNFYFILPLHKLKGAEKNKLDSSGSRERH